MSIFLIVGGASFFLVDRAVDFICGTGLVVPFCSEQFCIFVLVRCLGMEVIYLNFMMEYCIFLNYFLVVYLFYWYVVSTWNYPCQKRNSWEQQIKKYN